MKNFFNQTLNDMRWARVISLGLSFSFLIIFYGDVLFSPNSYLFNNTGDGIKNYFTYVTQIESPQAIESSKMNYPYGEYFLYLDCHPVLTLILRCVAFIFPSVTHYSVGIVNLLMLLSLPLTAWLVMLVLIRYRVHAIIAAISGFAIMVLAPQIFRMTGHYALSYSCFIPLSWYLYLRYKESERKWKWSAVLAVNALFWFYIHAYMGMIAVAFVGCLSFIDWLLSWRNNRYFYMRVGHLFVQSVLPLALFYFLTKLGDKHEGRTDNPFGFLEYTSNVESVFLPHHGPFVSSLQRFIHEPQVWEGWAYVGIGTMLALLVGVLFSLVSLFRKAKNANTDTSHLWALTLSAVLLLLISFGYPFIAGYEPWLNKLSILKNFRGIGRFAWAGYFILTLLAVVLLHRMYVRLQWGWLLLLPVSVAVLNVVEGVSYHQLLKAEVSSTANYFQRQHLSHEVLQALETVEWERYQAIIPLPFFHIGSENFGKEGNSATYSLSMLMGYHSGLPLMANYSTRTSILESKKIMQIISPPFYYKSIQEDIPSRQPFIVLDTKQEINKWEQYILNKSQVLYEGESLRILSIGYDQLFANASAEWIDDYRALQTQLLTKDGFEVLAKDSASYIHFNGFDESKSEFVLDGAGVITGSKKDYTCLKTFSEDELTPGKKYTASFWMYNNGPNYGQDMPGIGIFIQTRAADDSPEWHDYAGASGALIIDGDWSLMEFEFTAPDKACELYIKGDDFSQKPFYIDNLLIRENGVNVYRYNEQRGMLFMNNHRIVSSHRD